MTPTVIKVGGSCLDDLPPAWWDDLAEYAARQPVVLVHGWSKPLKALNPRHSGPEAILRDRYGNQSRWTTPEVIDDIKTVSVRLAGQVIDRLRGRGVRCDHVFGSGGLVQASAAERWWWRGKELVELDNLVGPVAAIGGDHLPATGPGRSLLVTPLARNQAGREVNTDADRAAAALAGAVRSRSLVLVTDVEHLLIDGTPVRRIGAAAVAEFRDRRATGGMRKKLRAATEAIDRGVERVVIGSAPVTDLVSGHTGTVITGDTRT